MQPSQYLENAVSICVCKLLLAQIYFQLGRDIHQLNNTLPSPELPRLAPDASPHRVDIVPFGRVQRQSFILSFQVFYKRSLNGIISQSSSQGRPMLYLKRDSYIPGDEKVNYDFQKGKKKDGYYRRGPILVPQ